MSALTALSHSVVYVHDLDEALAFYTEKLGLEVRTDQTMEGFRWVTVGAGQQPDLEISLMDPRSIHDEDTASKLLELVRAGALGAGVFRTEDCQATYEAFKARGVEFRGTPTERPYGIEAMFSDNSGNWFSLTQPFGA